MKLVMAVIVKDEMDDVKRILKDYYSIFDEVHIAVDNNFDEFDALRKDYSNLIVHRYTWINDFSHKRNFIQSKITQGAYVFRMDCDDEIINPMEIRKSADLASKSDVGLVYAFYDYAHDEDGNVIAGHYRETIIRNEPNLYWNKPIHENIIVRDTSKHKYVMDKSFKLKHRKGHEEYITSAIRNIELLLEEFHRDRDNTDPRTIAYIGRSLIGIGEYEKAKFFLVKHITKSGWDEDRYMSRCQLAECHLQCKEMEEARLCCTEAMMEMPSYPDAYLKLHEIYFEEGNWNKAVYWGEEGAKRRFPDDSVMMVDPSSYTWRPAITLAYSYYQLGEYDKALSLFKYAKKLAPHFGFIKNNEQMFEDGVNHRNFAEKFIYLANYIKKREPQKLKGLFDSVPADMDDNVYIHNARNKMLPPKTWDKDSIVIYCGPVLDEWADPSVITGIGGSEEAVIYLSRELNKLGKKVTIFNGCGSMEGNYNGVEYVNYQKFNPKDTFDTLIAWRVSIFGFPIVANHKWVWLHDVFPTKGLPESHICNIDKVIVLSKFHRTLLPSFVPEDKILISSNGINPDDFKDYGVIREPHRCIYASSYDRGLEHLLTIWPDVRKEVPDAELYIYYGWNNIDKLIKTGDYYLDGFKKKMLKLLDQEGVYEKGRVGHIKLIKEYQKSSIYTYPCSYEEINCISVQKAQASGCYAITTDFAALDETSQNGVKVIGKGGVNNEQYKNELVKALKGNQQFSPYKPISWKDVADQWVQEL